MPQINLLSPGINFKKKETKGILLTDPHQEFQSISKALIISSSVCLVFLLVFWLILSFQKSTKEKQLVGLREKFKTLAINPKEIDSLNKEKLALEKKIQLIDTLSSRKFYYFEKLQQISDLIPDGIWLVEISIRTEKKQMPSGKNKDKNKDKDTGKDIFEKTTLVIKGKAVADTIQEEVESVDIYLDNLKNSNDFAKDFSEIKLNSVAKSTAGNKDIMTFDFICKTVSEEEK